MITRREAAKLAVMSVAAAKFAPLTWGQSATAGSGTGRPPVEKRKFTSDAVEATIARVKKKLGDTKLARMFENCYPNTLDTTVRTGVVDGKPDTFVITGDIPAMWLRDSTAQVWPYLPLVGQDEKLRMLLRGVIHRQARYVLIDAYANAFNYGPTGSEFDTDLTQMKPELHERKWEIDSLCYPVRLAHGYWKATDDASVLDGRWRAAARLIVETFRVQQRKHGPGPYSFRRETTSPNDTLNLDGYGNPVKPVGLIASGFRPSDDACIYPFLIPSNLFAVRSLRQLEEISRVVWNDGAFAGECSRMADEVEAAVMKYGIASHPQFGKIYAYEVDGFGNQLFIDDANVPSLMSLPYLDCVAKSDAVYQNTRRFVLSGANPYYFKGSAAEGVGGPHVGLRMIWPLGIIMRGLTSSDGAETARCLQMLVDTDAGTGFMHESFDQDDAKKFTRAWFAWANTLFGELVLKSIHHGDAEYTEKSRGD
ncbi:MAG: glycoside hydrolase family 125 protein [Acidobacteriaceae bacterium]